MLKELTESNILRAQHLDDDLLMLMRKLEPYLSNTIVLFMSDHGVLPKQVSGLVGRRGAPKIGQLTGK